MREQLKALSKETAIYGTSTVIGRFLNFLLVPFYVNVLKSTVEYGMATSLYTYIGFLSVIYPLGLEAAFFRYGARAEGADYDPEKEKQVFSSAFLVIVGVVSLLTLLALIIAPWLVKPIFFDPKSDISPMIPMLTHVLRLGAGILFFDSLCVLPFAVLRLEHKAVLFAFIRLTGIVVTLVLNFLFVMFLHWSVEGIFLANLIASILMFGLLLPTIIERLELSIQKSVLKKLLPFGFTNIPAYLSSMMVQVIDRPIVQAFLGLGVLGIYQANYRMGFIMMVFVSLFEYAWRPFFMRQSLKDDEMARKIFARVFTYFITIALLSFLALSWWLPYLVSTPIRGHALLKPAYLVGLPIIPVVLLAYVFQGAYTNFIAGIYIKEHNKVLPFITTLGAVVNILANFWLIPHLGIMGAALATLFAYMVMAITIYFSSQKVYPVAYDWPRIRQLSALVALAYAVERFVTLKQILVHKSTMLFFQTGLFAMVIAALFLIGFFSEGEKKALRDLRQSLFRL